MKKFITIALVVAQTVAASSPAFFAAPALADVVQLPKQGGSCAFRPDAPDRHVVVKGDTLWDISGRFLQNPWCWPEVWGMNRDEIRNPHWIYPGQIVYFDRVNGRLRLGSPVGTSTTERSADGKILTPQIRSSGLQKDAIPAIPANLIEPFLAQPLIVEVNELVAAPRVVGAKEGHVMVGKGDIVYVKGDLKGNKLFQVFRPGKPLKDPETHAVLGYEAVFVGDIKLASTAKTADGVDTFDVLNSKEELSVGDRLRPTPPTPIMNYVPHAPEQKIDARVVGVYGGVTQAGQNQIISINRGGKDGLDLGTVLQLSRTGKVVPDPTDAKKPMRLPDEHYGSLFIFRTFNKISYGLVMQVKLPVEVGDSALSPE